MPQLGRKNSFEELLAPFKVTSSVTIEGSFNGKVVLLSPGVPVELSGWELAMLRDSDYYKYITYS